MILTRKASGTDHKSLEVETGRGWSRTNERRTVDAHEEGLAICPKTGPTTCVIGRPGSRAIPFRETSARLTMRGQLTGRPLSSTFTVAHAYSFTAVLVGASRLEYRRSTKIAKERKRERRKEKEKKKKREREEKERETRNFAGRQAGIGCNRFN